MNLLTVNLTDRAAIALTDAATLTGHTTTDTVNRALEIYLILVGAAVIGEKVWLGQSCHDVRELRITWFRMEGETS